MECLRSSTPSSIEFSDDESDSEGVFVHAFADADDEDPARITDEEEPAPPDDISAMSGLEMGEPVLPPPTLPRPESDLLALAMAPEELGEGAAFAIPLPESDLDCVPSYR